MISARDRLIVPLDFAAVSDAGNLVALLGDDVGFYKIGYQLAFNGGLGFAAELLQDGKKVFLDMKLLDIDNTVSKGIENIVAMGVQMTTVHAYPKTMRAAMEVAAGTGLCVLGVTVLTSMDDRDVLEAGYAGSANDLILQRAVTASEIGMGGIVASAREAAEIRRRVDPEMAIVTPGIRPAGSAVGDQKRVMTPADAITAGATHLVVGRPITAAEDPRSAAQAVLGEIASATS